MSQPQLPAYLLNAYETLCGRLPDLNMGDPGEENTSCAGTPSLSYCGNLARWDTFENDAYDFLTCSDTLSHLNRCRNLPTCEDPKIEELNPDACTKEHTRAGPMTLSGRFIQRVVVPAVCVVETLTNPRSGTTATSLPTSVQFADSLRPSDEDNVPPAVIAKLGVNHDERVRLVGELKFCGTADLQHPVMLADLPGEISDPKELCNILGHAFNWMTMHKVLFGFFSSYNWTIFLRIAVGKDGKPCLYYTDAIPHSNVTSSNKTISVRTAFFYLVHLTGGPDAVWSIPQKDVDIYAGEYVSKSLNEVGKMQQPYSQSAMPDGGFR